MDQSNRGSFNPSPTKPHHFYELPYLSHTRSSKKTSFIQSQPTGVPLIHPLPNRTNHFYDLPYLSHTRSPKKPSFKSQPTRVLSTKTASIYQQTPPCFPSFHLTSVERKSQKSRSPQPAQNPPAAAPYQPLPSSSLQPQQFHHLQQYWKPP